MSFNDEQRRLLFEILTETFSDNDLRELCFALNFDYEDLPGEGKRGKARELVAHVKRLEQTAVLVAKVRALRPDANWQKFDQAISSGQPSRLNEPDDNITRTDIFDEWTRVFQDLGREVWEQDQRAQFERAHAIIRSVLLTRDSGNLPAVEEVVEVALWLWEQLYEEVRDIVIPCLIWADQSGGRERMYERFRAGKPKERRLLRDPRLSDIAPDLAQHWYNWPPLQRDSQQDEKSDIARWLEHHDLSANPFGPRIADMDPFLIDSRAFPSQWDVLITRRSSAISTEIDYDRAAAALMLRHELQSAIPQIRFLIWQTLPLSSMRRSASAADCLRAVAHAAGETWILFLALNPSTLLDLPRPDQISLAELLLWSAGSRTALRSLLDQTGLKEDSESRALLRRLDALLNQERYRSKPSLEKLLTWLRIRPPGLDHTHFIVDCQLDLDRADCQAQATQLIGLASTVIKAGVSFKIYHSLSDSELPGDIERVPLRWERDHLLHMLSRRIYLASKERLQTFGELFGLEPFKAADDLLVDHAHGSLGKMLELGDTLIHEHIQRHKPDDHYLYPEDLLAVLQRSGSTA